MTSPCRGAAARLAPRRAARAQLLVALLPALCSAACFRYVPVEPGTVRPTEEVRVRLSEAAAVRLVPELGGYTGVLEGQLARESDDSLALSIQIGRQYQGVSLNQVRQTLVLGQDELVEVRRREFSRRKTLLAAAGAVVAFAALAVSIEQLRNPNDPGDDSPLPPPAPALLRITVGLPGGK